MSIVTRKLSLAWVLLVVATSSYASTALPTEEEIKGIQALCGSGSIQSASLKANLDAAIKSWKEASANASVEVAKSNLAGYLSRVTNNQDLAPVMQVYTGCVRDTLQQFLDRESREPHPVSSNGRSGALLRSAYISEDDIWREGCSEARDDAFRALAAMCPNGTISVTGESCPQKLGSPRTYSATLAALCRIN
ncbi:hypothetical protein [Solimonas flava]|uniref:hypothetical protein n=1 Tax=Solimonas flava TaxID=415849 RepID=UPI0012B55414|nr:hypothetical protein [Solimonas flava]